MVIRADFSDYEVNPPRPSGAREILKTAFRCFPGSIDLYALGDRIEFTLPLRGRNGDELTLKLDTEQLMGYAVGTDQAVLDDSGKVIGMTHGSAVDPLARLRAEVTLLVEPDAPEAPRQQWEIPKWSDTVVLPLEWVKADDYPLTDPADIDVPFEIINTSSPELARKVRDALNGQP